MDPTFKLGRGASFRDAGLSRWLLHFITCKIRIIAGTFLISAVSGHQDMLAGKAIIQNDGSALVSGYMAANTNAGYAIDLAFGWFCGAGLAVMLISLRNTLMA
jgi:hypothetical protein